MMLLFVAARVGSPSPFQKCPNRPPLKEIGSRASADVLTSTGVIRRARARGATRPKSPRNRS
eukprot:8109161-Pyramimonas_sp.AAC.1